MRKVFLFLVIYCFPLLLVAQEGDIHRQSDTYQWPTDPLVRQKLDNWQDQKFGMIIHWGLYSQAGIVESWELCSEPWIERDSTIAYEDFKKWYWGLKDKFNPVNFSPDQWALAAKNAGMRYVIFTTKHHDGFCMFDTHQTDFKITNGPFAKDPKANVARFVFEAFRKQGFMIGAYFSKPDWHSQDFWWSKYATPDRNVNYDIRKYSWRWNRFKNFTYNQIKELMSGYGSIDILWLDGGWVRPLETVNREVLSWGAPIPPWSQDVDIPRIASMARSLHPGLLIVDRTVPGLYENYQTPEQAIPSKALDHPWESCITLGNAWGYVPGDHYKSSTKVIHTLIEIVAKGGCLLLGVGPRPDGTLDSSEIKILQEVGDWLRVHGDAIYSTRVCKDTCRYGNMFFTSSKDGRTRYALVCLQEGNTVPTEVEWQGCLPKKGTTMYFLPTHSPVKWKLDKGKVKVSVPSSWKGTGICPALVFSF